MRHGKVLPIVLLLLFLLFFLFVLGVKSTVKTWNYTFDDEKISVKNSLSKCELYINDSLVDKKEGLMYTAEMRGVLSNGKRVYVKLGGTMSITCSVYIDDELQNPISND